MKYSKEQWNAGFDVSYCAFFLFSWKWFYILIFKVRHLVAKYTPACPFVKPFTKNGILWKKTFQMHIDEQLNHSFYFISWLSIWVVCDPIIWMQTDNMKGLTTHIGDLFIPFVFMKFIIKNRATKTHPYPLIYSVFTWRFRALNVLAI